MSQPTHCCEALRAACEDEDSPVTFIPKYREYGIRVLDGGTSNVVISFCPWSGDKLPASLRSEWFARLEDLGIDPGVDEIPEEFQTEQWYLGKES
ncbi:DUF6980 family protein [Luteibacter aegosomaticola]|uniref:DUF6980 family protein n=1 Tax=Luteibacter aegosomaticola TaxID=2911538 RepID=UPI003CCCAF64